MASAPSPLVEVEVEPEVEAEAEGDLVVDVEEPRSSSVPPPSTGAMFYQLGNLELLSNCAPAVLQQLAEACQLRTLSVDEELTDFAIVLVLRGSLALCAVDEDLAATVLAEEGAAFNFQAKGALPTRLIACEPSRVAVVVRADVERALASDPAARERLELVSRDAAVRAAAVAGRLSEIDEATRFLLLDRATTKRVGPNEVFLEAGDRCPGLVVVGVGSLRVGDVEKVRGDLVLPHLASQRGLSPHEVVAGPHGAHVLVVSPGALAVLSASNQAVSGLLDPA